MACKPSSLSSSSTDQLLTKNLEEQLQRLVSQLADLESAKSDGLIDQTEYEETLKETKDQLIEFEQSLARFKDGNVSAQSQVSAMQLTARAAVSNAFRAPQLIMEYSRREPSQLRSQITDLEREIKLGRITEAQGNLQKTELLALLKRMPGVQLSAVESAFLEAHATHALRQFAAVSDNESIAVSSTGGTRVLDAAARDLRASNN